VVTFDPAALKARVDELEGELSKPEFWNDQQRAAKLSAEHQRSQQKLQRYDELVSNIEFLREGIGTFPDDEHSYSVDPNEYETFLDLVERRKHV